MFELKVEHSFDSAHFLSGYNGKCANIHGHRWKVEVHVAARRLIEEGQLRGMIVDFADLKADVRGIIDFYDHALIVETGSLRVKTMECLQEEGFRVLELDFRPTAEQFSRFFYEKIREKGYAVSGVLVYETPTNCACYTGEEEDA